MERLDVAEVEVVVARLLGDDAGAGAGAADAAGAEAGAAAGAALSESFTALCVSS